MEIFNLCSEVITKELKRFNLDEEVYNSSMSALTATFSENFDVGYNRCAYMYRYATCSLCFFKNCIEKFLVECPFVKSLFTTWRLLPQRNLCSLSCGPGLDYLAFIVAILESDETPLEINNLTIISKFGAWRNTVNFVSESIEEGKLPSFQPSQLNFKNIDVIQGNVLELFTDRMKEALRNSNIILMMKTLNLSAIDPNQEGYQLKMLEELIFHLEPGSTIFFVDTKPSMSLMCRALIKYDGTYLYEPGHLAYKIPVTFPDSFKEKFGIHPVLSARGTFFIWQKLSFPLIRTPNTNMSVWEKLKLSIQELKAEKGEMSTNAATNRLRVSSLGSSSSCPSNENKLFDITGSLNSLNLIDNASRESQVSSTVPSVSCINSMMDDTVSVKKNETSSPSDSLKWKTIPSDGINDSSNHWQMPITPCSEGRNGSVGDEFTQQTNYEKFSPSPFLQGLFITPGSEQFSLSSSMVANVSFDQGSSAESGSIITTNGKSDNVDSCQMLPGGPSIKSEVKYVNSHVIKKPTEVPVKDLNGSALQSSAKCLPVIVSDPTCLQPSVKCKLDNRFSHGDTSSNSCPVSPKKEASRRRRPRNKTENSVNNHTAAVESKVIQTDPVMETKSDGPNSVRLLTDRIRKLVTSVEQEMEKESGSSKTHEASFTDCRNVCPNQQTNQSAFLNPMGNGDNAQGISSCFHDINHSGLDNRTLLDGQEPHRRCCSSYSRADCYQRKCCLMPHCFRQCCPPSCHMLHVPGCYHSPCEQSHINGHINTSVPNIVIPLQNVNSDVLSQIILALKNGTG